MKSDFLWFIFFLKLVKFWSLILLEEGTVIDKT